MSTNMLSLAPTAMQKIYENTCLELVRDLSKDLVQDKPTNDSYTSVNGLGFAVEEINFTSGVQELMNKYHNPKIRRRTDGSAKVWSSFGGNMDITKVGNADMSIKEAKAIIGEIYRDIKENLYGVLLMDTKPGRKRQIVNLLHPVTVHNLLGDVDFKQDEKVWTMAIYSFKEGARKKLKSKYEHAYNKENYAMELATILASIDTPSLYYVENKNFQVDIKNDKFILNYDEIKTLKESGKEIEEKDTVGRNYIVPGQIINIGGVAYPYYGTIYSIKGLAWNLGPMQGANIAHPEGQSTSKGFNGGSRICTHSGNSKTQAGVSSLNHCNTTSPLNSDCMENGSMTYAEQSVAASIELLLGEEYATGLAKGSDKAMTFQEFVKENDGATKKQYLTYIKNRLKSKMAEESGPMVKSIKQEKNIHNTRLWKKHISGIGQEWKDGEISYVGDFENPMMYIDGTWQNIQSDGVKTWLTTNEYIGIEPKEKYEMFDSGKDYTIGDVVIDKYMVDNSFKGLRIYTEGGLWEDYIAPFDLSDIPAENNNMEETA